MFRNSSSAKRIEDERFLNSNFDFLTGEISRIHKKLNKVHPDDLNDEEPRASVMRRFSSWYLGLQN